MGKVIVFIPSLMVLLVAVTPVTGEPIRIEGSCYSNTQPDVDVLEANLSPYYSQATFYCYGSDFATSTATLEWTLDNSSGQRVVLATCYGTSNCTSVYNSTVLSVVQSTTSYVYPYSQLYLYSIGRDFSGTLKCTETLKDGTTNSTTCRITVKRAYIIRSGDVYNAVEGSNNSITCNFPRGLTPSVVSWTLHTSSGLTLDFGNCSAENNCTSSHVSRSSELTYDGNGVYVYDYSVVIITNVARYKTGQLTCSFSYSGVVYSDSIQLHVYSDAYSVENCTAVVQRENWTVAISCDVDHLFSTSGSYEISVHNSLESLERRSFSDQGLTQYTDVTGRQFYRGRVFYFWKLPAVHKEYLYFSARVDSGETSNWSGYIKNRVLVAPPATPAINCSGFTDYIPENVTCVCTVDNLGSPEGRLRWLLGDTVMATGPYGVRSLKFPPWKMTRHQDGLTLVCQLDWIEQQNTSMVTRVAYGPDDVGLQVSSVRDTNGTSYVSVNFLVTGMNPMTPDLVTWTGPCQGQRGFTCTLTTSDLEENDVKVVTCTVTNTANNGRSASASTALVLSSAASSTIVILSSADVDTNKSLKKEAARMKWTAVALGVVLAVVVVAVIVAVVVIKCRKSKSLDRSTVVKSKPNKPVPQPKLTTQSKIVTYV